MESPSKTFSRPPTAGLPQLLLLLPPGYLTAGSSPRPPSHLQRGLLDPHPLHWNTGSSHRSYSAAPQQHFQCTNRTLTDCGSLDYVAPPLLPGCITGNFYCFPYNSIPCAVVPTSSTGRITYSRSPSAAPVSPDQHRLHTLWRIIASPTSSLPLPSHPDDYD